MVKKFTVEGHVFYFEENNPLYIYYSQGCYESYISDLLKKILNKESIFFDIGAHIGYHSLLASSLIYGSGFIIAFEPDEEAFRYLKTAVDYNGVKNILLEQKVIADQNSVNEFYIMESGLSSLISPKDRKDSIFGKLKSVKNINSIRLDDYCKLNSINPDCIKIDIEGGEFYALHGMMEILNRNKPNLIIDLHGIKNVQIIHLLRSIKYNVYIINQFSGLCAEDDYHLEESTEVTIYASKE